MPRVPTWSNSSNGDAPRPYFESFGHESVDKLVGFDVREASRRLHEWLASHEHEDPVKTQAVEDVGEILLSIQHLSGPRRVGQRRWYAKLSEAISALEDLSPYVAVRAEETNHEVGNASKGSRESFDRVATRVMRIQAAVASLLRDLQAARKDVMKQPADYLPDVAAMNAPLSALAYVESRLTVSGFSNREVARLIPDLTPEAPRQKGPEDAHVDRIRARALKVKAEVRRQQNAARQVNLSIDAFEKTLGRPIDQWNERDHTRWHAFHARFSGASTAKTRKGEPPKRGKR
jgi:hypothetical protein